MIVLWQHLLPVHRLFSPPKSKQEREISLSWRNTDSISAPRAVVSSVEEWQISGYTGCLPSLLQSHLLVHMGLLRTGLNILAGLHYCFHYYNHYTSSTFEEPTGFFFFNKTNKKARRLLVLRFPCLRHFLTTT